MKTNVKKIVSVLLVGSLFTCVILLGACAGKKAAQNNTNVMPSETQDAAVDEVEETTLDAEAADLSVDEETAKEIADLLTAFAKAVNDQDWELVQSFFTEDAGTYYVDMMKQYRVADFEPMPDTLSKNPVNRNAYICGCSYDIDYEGANDPKDVGLGSMTHVEKTADGYKVSAVFTTGL